MRREIGPEHPFAAHGIDETMSVDRCLHSLFGTSKPAADVLVQEYGRYFGWRTAGFRAGCLTGPGRSGTTLHRFLAYLVKCAVTRAPYHVPSYKGKQVRDNIHSYDLVKAFRHFIRAPRSGAIYNIGGSRHSNCSMLEAIASVGTTNWAGDELVLLRPERHRRPYLVDFGHSALSVGLSRLALSPRHRHHSARTHRGSHLEAPIGERLDADRDVRSLD